MSSGSASSSRARGTQTHENPEDLNAIEIIWQRFIRNAITCKWFKRLFSAAGEVCRAVKDKAAVIDKAKKNSLDGWETIGGKK